MQLAERLKEAQEKGLAGDGAEPPQEAKDSAQPLKSPSPKLQDEKPGANETEALNESKGPEADSAPTVQSPDAAVVEAPPSLSKEVTPAPLEQPQVKDVTTQPIQDELRVVDDGKGVGDSMLEDKTGEGDAETLAPVKEDTVQAKEPSQVDSSNSEVAQEGSKVEREEPSQRPGSDRQLSPPVAAAQPARSPKVARSPSSKAETVVPSINDQRAEGSTSRRRSASPERSRDIEVAMDAVRPVTKRSREDDDRPIPSKRSKSTYNTSLPKSLSHLVHPPTSNLYITNLRRPLLIPALHDYLLPARHPADLLPSTKGPFASEDYPGLWLSGVKDHAYATYPSVEDALETAEKVEGVVWPEDTGEQLHVEFIPDEELRGLVEKEEFAWANGRQKLTLSIRDTQDGIKFDLSAAGNIGGSRNPSGRGSMGDLRNGSITQLGGPRGIPLSGANSIGAPTGPSRGVTIRGRGGLPPMGGLGRSEINGQSSGIRPGMATGAGRLVNPMKRTRVRPNLFYKEGPGGEA